MRQDVRQVPYLIGAQALRQSQEQTPRIHDAVELDSTRTRATHTNHTAEVVLSQQQALVPVGFEVMVYTSSVTRQHIVVGVDNQRSRIVRKGAREHKQRMRPEVRRAVDKEDTLMARSTYRLSAFVKAPRNLHLGGVEQLTLERPRPGGVQHDNRHPRQRMVGPRAQLL